jgi:3',5'-cyclic AMP phosphodiesterase CpdA
MKPKFFILLLTACFSAFSGKTQTLADSSANTSKEIAFASDTQAPMWVETLWLKANHNRAATKMIFNSIMDRDPSSLFILGDVVNLGYSNRQWRPMDKYIQSLRDKGIKVDAVLGNHEVMGQAKKGQKKFQQRFPDHVRTGYVEIVDSIAVVLLNSNFNTLTPAEDAEQVSWYKKTLEQLDADPAVQFIITGCHHSPFTNSKIVAPNAEVQKKFVPPFLASKKSRLFLSGHCHNFEHYQFGGKDFLVIGGGGGLHQPLRPNNTTEPDLAIDYKPLFHYLTVRRVNDHLQVCSHELKKDFTGFDSGLTFSINKLVETEKKVDLASK